MHPDQQDEDCGRPSPGRYPYTYNTEPHKPFLWDDTKALGR